MPIVKFETLKRKAIEQLYSSLATASGPMDHEFLAMQAAALSKPPMKPRQLAREWLDYGIKLIENWDIRAVGRLIKAFPGILPRGVSPNHMPSCYMSDDEGCTWMVEWGGA